MDRETRVIDSHEFKGGKYFNLSSGRSVWVSGDIQYHPRAITDISDVEYQDPELIGIDNVEVFERKEPGCSVEVTLDVTESEMGEIDVLIDEEASELIFDRPSQYFYED